MCHVMNNPRDKICPCCTVTHIHVGVDMSEYDDNIYVLLKVSLKILLNSVGFSTEG